MKIKQVSWSDIKHIPETYDIGGASFTKHKQKEIWFCIEDLNILYAVSKTLYVSKEIARICSIWTHPVFRGKGLATSMIQHQIKHARKNKFKKIQAISKEKIFQTSGFFEVKKYAEGSSIWELMI